jgi:hypothetical protein
VLIIEVSLVVARLERRVLIGLRLPEGAHMHIRRDCGCGGRVRTLEYPDSRGEVVDTPGGADSGGEDGGRGDQIVCETVVQISLCKD